MNGEQQKRSEEVLPEVVTSFKLSNLRNVCIINNSFICVSQRNLFPQGKSIFSD